MTEYMTLDGLDLFGQDTAILPPLPLPVTPLAKGARVEILRGSYAGLTGRVVSTWTRPDGQPMCDLALDAGYVVSVRVSGVGRL